MGPTEAYTSKARHVRSTAHYEYSSTRSAKRLMYRTYREVDSFRGRCWIMCPSLTAALSYDSLKSTAFQFTFVQKPVMLSLNSYPTCGICFGCTGRSGLITTYAPTPKIGWIAIEKRQRRSDTYQRFRLVRVDPGRTNVYRWSHASYSGHQKNR